MSNKAELLKRIDQAASQYGDKSQKSRIDELKSYRAETSKLTGKMVIEGGHRTGLSNKDLEQLDAGKFEHGKTLLSGAK